MNIQKAVKAALEQNKWITRPEWENHTRFEPTNGPECIILKVIKDGKVIRSSLTGWQPQADDLMADDWKIVEKCDYNGHSHHIKMNHSHSIIHG